MPVECLDESHYYSRSTSSELPHARLAMQRPFWNYRRKTESTQNFLAAFFYMITVALLCMSLAQIGWFHVSSSVCSHNIAAYEFFSLGHFDTLPTIRAHASQNRLQEASVHPEANAPLVRDGTYWVPQFHTFGKTLVCITPHIATIMRTVVGFCLLSVATALLAFILDISGPKRRILRVLKVNAIPGIITVVSCIVMIALCSYVTILLQDEVIKADYRKAEVSFEYGYFIIMAAGILSLIATGLDMVQFRTPRNISRRRSAQRTRLLNDWDNEDTVYRDITYPNHWDPPPPPPYSP